MIAESHDWMRFFDPGADFLVAERRLPHWAQTGTVCFLTWRTWDSIPRSVLTDWLSTRASWLARHGIDPLADAWGQRLADLPGQARAEFHRLFSLRWHNLLDECHGDCVFRRPALAGIVSDSLKYFGGVRYTLTDFVVMPNHVHALAIFPDGERMLAQCENWKHYTAVRLNKAIGRTGRFWQIDGFDHLVRSAEQFDWLRTYIANNPAAAGLKGDEFVYFSQNLTRLREPETVAHEPADRP